MQSGDRESTHELIQSARQQHEEAMLALQPLQVLDGYRIVRVIGRGGMGVVYEAQQTSPPRVVALKVVRAGAHIDPYYRRRFRREVRALGRLQHPYVATIYEAGIAADGQQYLVMEYVRGIPLRRFIRQNDLSLSQKLELFCKICEAVQHAHQHGVLHLDLKPANVLVDTEGHPKLLDFGLARLTNADGDGKTSDEEASKWGGTPPYVSPERFRIGDRWVDVRSDVYSLGVMLHELLTDELPSRDGFPSWLKRSGSAENLDSIYPDLFRVVAKATDPEMDRRHESVRQLASDVMSHSRDHVRPFPSRASLLLSRVSRRFTPALNLAILVFSLAAAIVWRGFELRRGEGVHRESADAQPANTVIEGPSRHAALAQLDQLSAVLATTVLDDPVRAAAINYELGATYFAFGRPAEAVTRLELALQLQEQAFGPDHPSMVMPLQRLAAIYRSHADFVALVGVYERLSSVVATGGDVEGISREVVRQNLARALAMSGETSRASQLVDDFCDALRRTTRDNNAIADCLLAAAAVNDDAGRITEAAIAYDMAVKVCSAGGCAPVTRMALWAHYSWHMHSRGDLESARALRRRAADLGRTDASIEVAQRVDALKSLALSSIDFGDVDEAQALFEEVVATLAGAVDFDDPRLLGADASLAGLQWLVGDYSEAEPVMRHRWSIERNRTFGSSVCRTASAGSILAVVLRDQEKYDEAEQLFYDSLAAIEASEGVGSRAASDVLINLARLEAQRGNFEMAEFLADRSLQVRRSFLAADHPDVAEALLILGWATSERTQGEDGLQLAREGLAIRNARFSAQHWHVAEAKCIVGRCLSLHNQPAGAASNLREAAAVLRSTLLPGHKLNRQVTAFLQRM